MNETENKNNNQNKSFNKIVIVLVLIVMFCYITLKSNINELVSKLDNNEKLINNMITEVRNYGSNLSINNSTPLKTIDNKDINKPDVNDTTILKDIKELITKVDNNEKVMNNVLTEIKAYNNLSADNPTVLKTLEDKDVNVEKVIENINNSLNNKKYKLAIAYLRNAFEKKIINFENLEEIHKKIINADIDSNNKLELLDSYLSFLNSKVTTIESNDIEKLHLRISETESIAASLMLSDEPIEDLSLQSQEDKKITEEDKDAIRKIIFIEPNETDVDKNLEKLQNVLSGKDISSDLQQEVTTWTAKAIVVSQATQIKKEIELILKDFLSLDEEYLLVSAQNQLLQYGDVCKIANRVKAKITPYDDLNNRIIEVIDTRNEKYFNENIKSKIQEFNKIKIDDSIFVTNETMVANGYSTYTVEKTQTNETPVLKEIDKKYEEIVRLSKKLIRPSEKILSHFNEVNYEKKILEVYSIRIDNIIKSNPTIYQEKIDSITKFLGEPGTWINRINDEKLKKEFNNKIEKLKKVLNETYKCQNAKYQVKALEIIDSIYQRHKEKEPTFSGKAKCAFNFLMNSEKAYERMETSEKSSKDTVHHDNKLLKENLSKGKFAASMINLLFSNEKNVENKYKYYKYGLYEIDVNYLNLDVRRSYDIVFEKLYNKLDDDLKIKINEFYGKFDKKLSLSSF